MPEVAHDEAGRRCSAIIRQHIVDGHAGRWAAIRLSDGGSDCVPYDTRADAIRHQLHETLCAYVKIPRDDMPPGDATRYLQMHRGLYDAGARLIDPDRPDHEVILPERREDIAAAVAALERKAGLPRAPR